MDLIEFGVKFELRLNRGKKSGIRVLMVNRVLVRPAEERDDRAVGELLVRAFVDAYAAKKPEFIVSPERHQGFSHSRERLRKPADGRGQARLPALGRKRHLYSRAKGLDRLAAYYRTHGFGRDPQGDVEATPGVHLEGYTLWFVKTGT